jgi:[ribosomal protein S5]-alanine N-acetyltransferase
MPGFARLLGIAAPFAGPDGPFHRQNASRRGPAAVKPNTKRTRAAGGTNGHESRVSSHAIAIFGRSTAPLAQRAPQGTRVTGGSARMAAMDAAWQPPAPTGSWTVSRRLVLRPVPWDAVQAITAGRRLPGWADDYPAEGDAMIAGLLFRAGPAAWPGANQAWGHRQVVERTTGLVVGGIGFAGPPGAAGEVELGYGIVPSRQGRGYATEAVAAMAAVAWADPVVEAVVATTATGNAASRRVLEKAGFRLVAADEELRFRLPRPR